ncbi:MAG: SDR family NAD(P)-dependent oxidoreductase, partial [Hyphomicrobiales bacterium]|nr:SDR family NAD(P)-dependent oxidoreductase [Hyphomicrobiales bacterium]
MPSSHARLLDRRALVTGGSRGIGRAVVERFAAEGATVAINYASHEEEARKTLEAARASSRDAGHGEKPHLITRADLSDLRAVEAMLKAVVEALGRLDIVVNNAGIQQELPGDSPDPKGLEHVLGVNLVGAGHCSQLAIRHFLSRGGGGVIINTSSVHQIIPKPGFLGYSLSKGG